MGSRSDRRERWRERQTRARDQEARARLKASSAAWTVLGQAKNGRRKQRKLISELIETRREEIIWAYPEIVSLGIGFRTKGNRVRRRGGQVLTVWLRKKLADLGEERQIPAHLFAYGVVERKRRLCAIPTDVQCLESSSLEAQSSVQVTDGVRTVEGSIAAVVKLRDAFGQLRPGRFALSCLHVLGMAQDYHPDLPQRVEIMGEDGQELAKLTRHTGYLVDDQPSGSFDAALAKITDRGGLSHVCPRPRPGRFLRSLGSLPDRYTVRTPRGDISARYATHVYDFPIPYRSGPLHSVRIRHSLVIESEADTFPGDSGSAVVSEDGRTLLGMHIAGGNGSAFMIPAFELSKPGNYDQLATDSKISLDPSF